MGISIRRLELSDILAFDALLEQQPGRVDESDYARKCFEEQSAGRRDVFIAFLDKEPCGFAQLLWNPVYAPFRKLGIPEIQDLAVIPSARRQGIGLALVLHCEDVARAKGRTEIGIGVGLYAGYGAAQRLYVAQGYIPDGFGVVYDNVPVMGGELRAVDDLLVLKMVKTL